MPGPRRSVTGVAMLLAVAVLLFGVGRWQRLARRRRWALPLTAPAPAEVPAEVVVERAVLSGAAPVVSAAR